MRLHPLAGVYHLSPGAVRVGLALPTEFTGLRPDDARWLASLEGGNRQVTAQDRRTRGALIAQLERSGLLVDHQDNPLGAVRLRGLTNVGEQIAVGLARAGVRAISLVDQQLAASEPPWTFPLDAHGGTCASAAARAVQRARASTRVMGPHHPVELEVIVASGAVDVVVQSELMATSSPHLAVITDEAGVTISPVVVPGRTACLRCANLFRTDSDPHWPVLTLQAAHGRRGRAEPVVAQLAAAMAVAQAVAFLQGRAPGETAMRVDAVEPHHVATTEFNPHPACGCGAAGPPGDELAARRAAMR